jgi:hypothetical protein
MIIDNDPLIERHISVPKDMNQLSCSSFTAGIVEAVLDGLGFVRRHASLVILLFMYFPACSRHCSQYSNGTARIPDNYSYQAGEIRFGQGGVAEVNLVELAGRGSLAVFAVEAKRRSIG